METAYFIGKWKNDRLDGTGTLRLKDDTTYIGQFKKASGTGKVPPTTQTEVNMKALTKMTPLTAQAFSPFIILIHPAG
jgi:hypothetical protein